MEMVKESRSERKGSQDIPIAPGKEAEADSGQIGERSDGVWLNERGEVCIGNKCFTLAINPNAEEVTVRVDRNECGADMQPIVDSLFEVIGRGGRTLYESTSLVKK